MEVFLAETRLRKTISAERCFFCGLNFACDIHVRGSVVLQTAPNVTYVTGVRKPRTSIDPRSGNEEKYDDEKPLKKKKKKPVQSSNRSENSIGPKSQQYRTTRAAGAVSRG